MAVALSPSHARGRSTVVLAHHPRLQIWKAKLFEPETRNRRLHHNRENEPIRWPTPQLPPRTTTVFVVRLYAVMLERLCTMGGKTR